MLLYLHVKIKHMCKEFGDNAGVLEEFNIFKFEGRNFRERAPEALDSLRTITGSIKLMIDTVVFIMKRGYWMYNMYMYVFADWQNALRLLTHTNIHLDKCGTRVDFKIKRRK